MASRYISIIRRGLCAITAFTLSAISYSQSIYQYKSDDATICFFNKDQAQYIPHLMRKYQLGHELHGQIWGDLPEQAPFMMLSDGEDDGNAGVSTLPHTVIQIGMAPINMSYFVAPTNERYDHLFKHEYTHVVMTDKTNRHDIVWRKITGDKVVPNSTYPLSAFWSYLDAPRWYAPRWFHEGIACFMETWLGDGAGRALGGYDEAYFRTCVQDGRPLYSVVGLESEGTTSDFQQGATAYLYGTRFVNYLVLKYGYDKLIEFYNRDEDSKVFYARQFQATYGKSLRTAWKEWQEYEKEHQEENLEIIAEYPLTETEKLIEKNLGAMSPMVVDDSTRVAYAAVNYPGEFAQVVKFSLDGSKVEHIADIQGVQMYQTAYLAYDRKGQRLIWTDNNDKVRGLVVYDLGSRKRIAHLTGQRTADICYDNARNCMYGIMSAQGVSHLVKYDSKLEKREILYSFPFGVSVGDLDVSHDGRRLVMSILGQKGDHSLIMFDTSELEDAGTRYETLHTLEDSNLSQFRFSEDDSLLLGFSYYTGVPNIWSLDPGTKEFNLVSNVQTGLFAPYLKNDGKVYALEFSPDGMTPVSFRYNVIHDANSVSFLGQKAYEANPQLAELSTLKKDVHHITFGEVYDSVKVYKPFKELKLQGAYPDISGFTDKKAFNNVTPVLGYHLAFYDPLSVFTANIFIGVSPWSNNDWSNRFHINADAKYKNWSLTAAWNQANFYDLFGPSRSSRKGYQTSLSYNKSHSTKDKFTWGWGATVSHYGGLDALPLYQEIEVEEGVTSFQTLSMHINGGKVRGTLGAVTAEQGYRFEASTYTYYAGGELFPSAQMSGDLGFHLPFGLHNSFWIKGIAGQSLCASNSSWGKTYFGGFKNTLIDHGEVNRYRTLNSMPGVKIDQIPAHSYVKFTGELNFSPVRFNNVGATQCYPNYAQFTLFCNELMTDYWGEMRAENKASYVSVGGQLNIQMVLFTHMSSTLSFGYARVYGNGKNSGEFMVSLKIL